jgi:hypothetical protein
MFSMFSKLAANLGRIILGDETEVVVNKLTITARQFGSLRDSTFNQHVLKINLFHF